MRYLLLIIWLIGSNSCQSQEAVRETASCHDAQFDQEVGRLLNFSIPVMDVDTLKRLQTDVTLLDARELEEYLVSHIPGAVQIGYEKPNFDVLKTVPKDKPVVVYCSVGYRSEKIAERLKKKGFAEVYNLYGSIFEWANRGNALVDGRTAPTTKIHTYNEKWSQWVKNERLEKTW